MPSYWVAYYNFVGGPYTNPYPTLIYKDYYFGYPSISNTSKMDRIPTMIPHIWIVNLWKKLQTIFQIYYPNSHGQNHLTIQWFLSNLAQPLFGQLPKIPRVPHSLLTAAKWPWPAWPAWRWVVSNFANWYNGDIMKYNLVGGLEHGFYDFPETVGNGIIIPTDELHHFSEG